MEEESTAVISESKQEKQTDEVITGSGSIADVLEKEKANLDVGISYYTT